MAQSKNYGTNEQKNMQSSEQLNKRYGVRRFISRFFLYLFLCLTAAVCLLPFYSMIISSTHSNSDIATKLLLLPGGQFLDNYSRLMQTVNVWRGFANSLMIAVPATVLSLYFSALTAYGFSKYQFRGNKLLFGAVLASMMIPGQLGIIGFFQLMHGFHMLNTYWPLILPSIANAFNVFFLKQICDDSISNELIEAARIDGAGEIRIFHKLALPLLMPGLSALAIFTFITNWNSFLNPLIILFDNAKQPLPVMIAMTQGSNFSDYGAQYVGVVISVVPIIILFAVMSKKIIGSLSVGALKG